MGVDDPVDETSMIFTEADVYMIGGYLAQWWDVDLDREQGTLDIEKAIMVVLQHVEGLA